jgi:hypothetical protein
MKNKQQNLTESEKLRVKAEEKLKEQQHKLDKPGIEADVKRLVHELQVHQIELEMQNEELRQANETAEAALKNFTMLYDFSPMGYFTLDYEGCICELNFTGAEILGDKRFSFIDRNFKLFIAESSLAVFNKFFHKVFVTNAKESCEVMLAYDSSPLCRVYIEGIVTGEDKRCLLSVVDISEFQNKDSR